MCKVSLEIYDKLYLELRNHLKSYNMVTMCVFQKARMEPQTETISISPWQDCGLHYTQKKNNTFFLVHKDVQISIYNRFSEVCLCWAEKPPVLWVLLKILHFKKIHLEYNTIKIQNCCINVQKKKERTR